MAIVRAVVYYNQAAHALSAGIECRYCTTTTNTMLMNIILTVEVIMIIPIMGNMIGIKEMSRNDNHINHRVSDNNGHDKITFSFDVYFTLN